MSNWILIGFKGAGKTYFGSRLGLPFLDTDQLIEQRENLSVQEIVRKQGFPYFRGVEAEIIANLDVDRYIIATGGGSLLWEENRNKLKKMGTLIYLKSPKELLKERFSFENFEEMYSTRIPQYEKIASFTVETENRTDEQVLEALWQVINLETSFGSPHGESLTEKRSELSLMDVLQD